MWLDHPFHQEFFLITLDARVNPEPDREPRQPPYLSPSPGPAQALGGASEFPPCPQEDPLPECPSMLVTLGPLSPPPCEAQAQKDSFYILESSS